MRAAPRTDRVMPAPPRVIRAASRPGAMARIAAPASSEASSEVSVTPVASAASLRLGLIKVAPS
jgi:hypothetical protein